MKECDLIMKGGITSGVVYPHAIRKIAQEYRLRSIGGTSAGAIGAVFAAAAEHRRQASGGADTSAFDELAEVARELAGGMGDLFQPDPKLKPLFSLMMASVSSKEHERAGRLGTAKAFIAAFPRRAAFGAVIVLIFAIIAASGGGWWALMFGLLLGILAAAATMTTALQSLITKGLPANDFGICTGLQTDPEAGKGVTEWISDHIDALAGAEGGAPLTVGQLERCGINLAAMTTDLSSGRPYQLPLRTEIHYFSSREFRRILPGRVVDFMIAKAEKRTPHPDEPDDLYRLPVGDDFPALLVARMSLSFPFLISAVPLYRDDYKLPYRKGASRLRRCLFSDGGITSNFPVHFFDALIPGRPTFGIALARYDEDRDGGVFVDIPESGSVSANLPIRHIGTVGQFFSAIVNTAKDWQDTLQTMLTGYAERVVTIRLDPEREGGMNLDMEADLIEALGERGKDAADTLLKEFDFNQHRYNRAIATLPKLEDALTGFAATYDREESDQFKPQQWVMVDFPTENFKNSKRWRKDVFHGFGRKLADIGKDARSRREDDKRQAVSEGRSIPSSDSDIRQIASANRVPASARAEAGAAPPESYGGDDGPPVA